MSFKACCRKYLERDLRKWAEAAEFNPIGYPRRPRGRLSKLDDKGWSSRIHVFCLRQGHDSLTSIRHYQGLAFSEEEKGSN